MVQRLVWLVTVRCKDWVLGTVGFSLSAFEGMAVELVNYLTREKHSLLQLLICFLQMPLQLLNIKFLLLPLFLLCLFSVLGRHLDAKYGRWAACGNLSSSLSCWYGELSDLPWHKVEIKCNVMRLSGYTLKNSNLRLTSEFVGWCHSPFFAMAASTRPTLLHLLSNAALSPDLSCFADSHISNKLMTNPNLC